MIFTDIRKPFQSLYLKFNVYSNHELQQEIISKEITEKMSIVKTFNNILTRFGNASYLVTTGKVEGFVVFSDERIGTICILWTLSSLIWLQQVPMSFLYPQPLYVGDSTA